MSKKNSEPVEAPLDPVDAIAARKESVARKLAFWLGSHQQERWVSPNGYVLIKVTRCEQCGRQAENVA